MDAILMQQKQIIINNCFIENAEDTLVILLRKLK